MSIINYISILAMPIIILFVIIYGLKERMPIFDSFLKGANDGVEITFKIFPTLVGLFLAIGMLRSSGVLNFIINLISPLMSLIKFPGEVIPLALLRPISGSSSMAVATDIIKENGVDVKFLLNNGCSFNCGTCRMGNLQCKECFERNLIKFSAEELYALQSFFPFEIDILQSRLGNYECIKEFKISNRPCTYEYLNDCLNSYIYGKGKEEQYIQKSKMNYRLWGRLGHFNQYLEKMNINMIKKIKKEIWDML